MKTKALAVSFAVLAAPAFAQGDAAAGEEQFNRQCVACHVVQDAGGNVLAGRNAKTGPNLYGLAGRAMGAVEGFRYSDALVDAGAAGNAWTDENFAGFVQDPTGWMRDLLDDGRARSKMAYRVRDEAQAYDIYAYLSTFGE